MSACTLAHLCHWCQHAHAARQGKGQQPDCKGRLRPGCSKAHKLYREHRHGQCSTQSWSAKYTYKAFDWGSDLQATYSVSNLLMPKSSLREPVIGLRCIKSAKSSLHLSIPKLRGCVCLSS